MTLIVLPSLLVRAVCEVLFVLAAILVVSPRHARAGMLLAGAGLLNLTITLGQPIAECGGFTFLAQAQPNDPVFTVVIIVLLAFAAPIAQAVNLTLILSAILLLARELPMRRDVEPG